MPLPSSPRYSTLELARHDASASAPERDHAAVAPENARELDAPQAAFICDPETWYNNDLPEAVVGAENENKIETTDRAGPIPGPWSRRIKFTSIAIAAVIIFGIAFGIGLGEGLKKQSPTLSHSPGPTSNVTGTVTSRNGSTLSAEEPIFPAQILANTSLAIFSSSNGDRRLFFQDQSANIREAVYTASAREWSTSSNMIVTSDAKNYTPIAAIDISYADLNTSASVVGPSIDNYIHEANCMKPTVFYVRRNNTLACMLFVSDGWTNLGYGGCGNELWAYTVATDSRCLSATVSGANTSQVLLLYESLTGTVATLSASSVYYKAWSWKNSSSLWSSSLHFDSDLELRAPFSISGTTGGVSGWFASKYQAEQYTDKLLNINQPTDGSLATSYFYNESSVVYGDLVSLVLDLGPDSQWATSVVYLNGTSLNVQGGAASSDVFLAEQPSSSFRYPRLAGFLNNDSSEISFYLQLNATTITNNNWDISAGIWTSENITVVVI